jgi:hypothetical protein
MNRRFSCHRRSRDQARRRRSKPVAARAASKAVDGSGTGLAVSWSDSVLVGGPTEVSQIGLQRFCEKAPRA